MSTYMYTYMYMSMYMSMYMYMYVYTYMYMSMYMSMSMIVYVCVQYVHLKLEKKKKLIIVHTPDSRPYAKFAIKFVLGYQSNLPPPKSLNENSQRSKATPSKLIIFGEVIVIPLHSTTLGALKAHSLLVPIALFLPVNPWQYQFTFFSVMNRTCLGGRIRSLIQEVLHDV